jgi:hypothetical protein
MACKEHKQKISLLLFDELEENEKAVLEEHLAACRTCALRFREERELLQLMKPPAKSAVSPDWEGVWRRIQSSMDSGRSQRWFALPAVRWGFSSAAAVCILLLGIFIGRQTTQSTEENGWREVGRTTVDHRTLLTGYLEEVQPLLVDYANYKPSDQAANGGPVDKEIVASLLMQTRLLRRRLAAVPDPRLIPLIEELEIILTDIGNITPGDREAVQTVQETIRQRDIPLKLTLFQQENRTHQL